MRVMVRVKPRKESTADEMPSEKLLTDIEKFNDGFVNASIMLAGEGLRASSKCNRLRFSGNGRIITDGPFIETKELVAG
jgi:hypothetical protein